MPCPAGSFCPTAGASVYQPCLSATSPGRSACPSRRSLDSESEAASAREGGAGRTLLATAEGGEQGAASESAAAAPQPQGIDSMTAAAAACSLAALYASGLAMRRALRHGATLASGQTAAVAGSVK